MAMPPGGNGLGFPRGSRQCRPPVLKAPPLSEPPTSHYCFNRIHTCHVERPDFKVPLARAQVEPPALAQRLP